MNDLLDRVVLLVKDYGLNDLNKSGQNFLVDSELLRKETSALAPSKDDIVLDIGTGFGFELEELGHECKIVAVEKDVKIFSYLINKYELNKNVQLINGDVLDMVLPVFTKVLSNPPYHLVDRILIKLSRYEFDAGVMILPKTITDGLLNGSADTNATRLTTYLGTFFELKELAGVEKDSFYPPPRVTSRMVLIKKKKRSLAQEVLKKDEMTVKNAILRSVQNTEDKTKRQSRETFKNYEDRLSEIKDKQIKRLNTKEMRTLIEVLEN